MEAKVISIVNQKGGVSKTSSASMLAVGLARRGFKVLAIDTDSQGNLSQALHADNSNDALCLADLMRGISVRDDNGDIRQIIAGDVIQHTDYCDVIASNKLTAKAATEFEDASECFLFLLDLVVSLRSSYDFIIFDTSPAKDIMIKSSLVASDGAIISTNCTEYASQGMADVNETINQARKRTLNPDLKIYGILLTKYQSNLMASKKMVPIYQECAEIMGTKLFNTFIRTDENVNKSQMADIPEEKKRFQSEKGVILYDYAPKSAAAIDYAKFIDELLDDLK